MEGLDLDEDPTSWRPFVRTLEHLRDKVSRLDPTVATPQGKPLVLWLGILNNDLSWDMSPFTHARKRVLHKEKRTTKEGPESATG